MQKKFWERQHWGFVKLHCKTGFSLTRCQPLLAVTVGAASVRSLWTFWNYCDLQWELLDPWQNKHHPCSIQDLGSGLTPSRWCSSGVLVFCEPEYSSGVPPENSFGVPPGNFSGDQRVPGNSSGDPHVPGKCRRPQGRAGCRQGCTCGKNI